MIQRLLLKQLQRLQDSFQHAKRERNSDEFPRRAATAACWFLQRFWFISCSPYARVGLVVRAAATAAPASAAVANAVSPCEAFSL